MSRPNRPGNQPPHRPHHPVGDGDDELAEGVAKGRARPLHDEAHQQRQREKTADRVEQEEQYLDQHVRVLSPLPSNVAQLAAARIGGGNAARRCPRRRRRLALKAASAASVVPPFEVTRLRKVDSDSLLCSASRAAPTKVSTAQLARRRGVEAELDAGRFHGFEEVEDIGRAAAGDRRDGIHLRLVADPDRAAHGAQDLLGIGAAVAVDARIGAQRGDAGADQGRRVGHGAHHGLAVAAQPARDVGHAQSGGDAHHQLPVSSLPPAARRHPSSVAA
jgi:hypothetical protein